MYSSLFFHINKKSKTSRFMKVTGSISQIETQIIEFDIEKNKLSFETTIDLSKITTDQEARDKNLLEKLFNKSQKDSKIAVKSNSVSDFRVLSENRYEIDITSSYRLDSMSSENTETKLTVLVEKRDDEFGGHHKISFKDSFTSKDLGINLPRFVKFFEGLVLNDNIEISWAQIIEEKETTRPLIHILGAGIAGLSAAQVLTKRGFEVHVYEKQSYVGGKLNSYIDSKNGHTVEHGIHGVFPSYVNLKALWNEYDIYTKNEVTKTKTTSMASDNGIKVFELSKVKGPFPFFLLAMIPKGVFKFSDYFSSIKFFIKVLRFNNMTKYTDLNFRGLARNEGVSNSIYDFFVGPYVKNLSYARSEELSAQAGVDALNHYLLEDHTRVKATWINGGPQEVILNPWYEAISLDGATIHLRSEIKGVNIENGKYTGLKGGYIFKEENLGTGDKSWVETIDNEPLAITWEAKAKNLKVFSALCTHQHCPIKESGKNGDNGFHCDCHGGHFEKDGSVRNAPPTSPLEDKNLYKYEENGKLRFSLSDSVASSGSKQPSYCISTLDIASFQKLCDKNLLGIPSLQYSTLLKTTDVAVLRLWFNKLDWKHPDSGFFAEEDILDNYFHLASFQDEFKDLENYTVIEAHIGEIEKISNFSDDDLIEACLSNLAKYFKDINFRQELNTDYTKILRHKEVFSLFAPGEQDKRPKVYSEDRKNLLLAGDWIDTKHNNWFMERSATTGIEASNYILEENGFRKEEVNEKTNNNILIKILRLFR